MSKIYRVFEILSGFIKSRPREAALSILVIALALVLGGKYLVSAVVMRSEKNECITDKQSLLDSYEQVDELLDSAYRFDSYSRSDIDRIRELKYSVDSMYERCKSIVPGWPN